MFTDGRDRAAPGRDADGCVSPNTVFTGGAVAGSLGTRAVAGSGVFAIGL